jgi:hypothetical protein
MRAALLVALAALGGCIPVQHGRYEWGSYNPTLYSYYKDPARAGELEASLRDIIDGKEHGAVPPGVFAEYGYLKLQQGKSGDAVAAFEQEKERWPESAVFMDRMITVAGARSPAASKEP